MDRIDLSDLLEAIEMYEAIIEKQDETITQMSSLIKKQALEIAQLRSVQFIERKEKG